jgi:hypothetical protein
MTIIWKSHAADHFLDLSNVFYGDVTGSDGTKVTIATSDLEIRLDGTFTGVPATDGTVTGFQLFRNGTLVLEAEGHTVSFAALLATMADPFDDDKATDLFRNDGDMVVKGSGAGEELFGGAFDDKLVGRGGEDYLFADGGNDLLKGGGGNDRLIGEDGKDVLKGSGGDDLLAGGFGKDLLVGGRGSDQFSFGSEFLKGDVDKIAKFQAGKDFFALYLDGVSSSEQLVSGQFRRGEAAKDGNDLVIHDRKTGNLFIDFDGKGGEGQIKFAKVDPGLQLSHDDFWLMPLS